MSPGTRHGAWHIVCAMHTRYATAGRTSHAPHPSNSLLRSRVRSEWSQVTVELKWSGTVELEWSGSRD